MDQMLELLKQIQELAGVGIDAIEASGAAEGGAPEGPPEGEAPPEGAPPGPPA